MEEYDGNYMASKAYIPQGSGQLGRNPYLAKYASLDSALGAIRSTNERGAKLGMKSINSTPSIKKGRYEYLSPDVPVSSDPIQAYQRLSDLNANAQPVSDMWKRGLIKMGGKTVANVLGGIGMVLDGTNQMLNPLTFGKDNRFWTGPAKLMETDFQQSMIKLSDSFDINENYNIYRTQAFNELSALGQVKTAPFWTDTVLGGMSFVIGAIVSTYATKGLGLAALGAGRAGIMAASSTALSALDKSAKVQLLGKAFSTAGQVASGSFFEAGVETHHYKKYATEQAVKQAQLRVGRELNEQEMLDITDKVNQTANYVFLTNAALVSASNFALYTKVFDNTLIKAMGSRLAKYGGKLSDASGLSTLGSKVSDIAASTKFGEKLAKKYNSTAVSFIKNGIKAFGKPIIMEGYLEEAGQYAITEGAMRYSLDSLDPTTQNEYANYFNAVAGEYSKNFNTKTFNEHVVAGAVIGLLGSPTFHKKNKQTGNLEFGIGWQLGFSNDFREYQKKSAERRLGKVGSASSNPNAPQVVNPNTGNTPVVNPQAPINTPVNPPVANALPPANTPPSTPVNTPSNNVPANTPPAASNPLNSAQGQIARNFRAATGVIADARRQASAESRGDIFEALNAKFSGAFRAMHRVIKSGSIDIYRKDTNDALDDMDDATFKSVYHGYETASPDEVKQAKLDIKAKFEQELKYTESSIEEARNLLAGLPFNEGIEEELAYNIAFTKNIAKRLSSIRATLKSTLSEFTTGFNLEKLFKPTTELGGIFLAELNTLYSKSKSNLSREIKDLAKDLNERINNLALNSSSISNPSEYEAAINSDRAKLEKLIKTALKEVDNPMFENLTTNDVLDFTQAGEFTSTVSSSSIDNKKDTLILLRDLRRLLATKLKVGQEIDSLTSEENYDNFVSGRDALVEEEMQEVADRDRENDEPSVMSTIIPAREASNQSDNAPSDKDKQSSDQDKTDLAEAAENNEVIAEHLEIMEQISTDPNLRDKLPAYKAELKRLKKLLTSNLDPDTVFNLNLAADMLEKEISKLEQEANKVKEERIVRMASPLINIINEASNFFKIQYRSNLTAEEQALVSQVPLEDLESGEAIFLKVMSAHFDSGMTHKSYGNAAMPLDEKVGITPNGNATLNVYVRVNGRNIHIGYLESPHRFEIGGTSIDFNAYPLMLGRLNPEFLTSDGKALSTNNPVGKNGVDVLKAINDAKKLWDSIVLQTSSKAKTLSELVLDDVIEGTELVAKAKLRVDVIPKMIQRTLDTDKPSVGEAITTSNSFEYKGKFYKLIVGTVEDSNGTVSADINKVYIAEVGSSEWSLVDKASKEMKAVWVSLVQPAVLTTPFPAKLENQNFFAVIPTKSKNNLKPKVMYLATKQVTNKDNSSVTSNLILSSLNNIGVYLQSLWSSKKAFEIPSNLISGTDVLKPIRLSLAGSSSNYTANKSVIEATIEPIPDADKHGIAQVGLMFFSDAVIESDTGKAKKATKTNSEGKTIIPRLVVKVAYKIKGESNKLYSNNIPISELDTYGIEYNSILKTFIFVESDGEVRPLTLDDISKAAQQQIDAQWSGTNTKVTRGRIYSLPRPQVRSITVELTPEKLAKSGTDTTSLDELKLNALPRPNIYISTKFNEETKQVPSMDVTPIVVTKEDTTTREELSKASKVEKDLRLIGNNIQSNQLVLDAAGVDEISYEVLEDKILINIKVNRPINESKIFGLISKGVATNLQFYVAQLPTSEDIQIEGILHEIEEFHSASTTMLSSYDRLSTTATSPAILIKVEERLSAMLIEATKYVELGRKVVGEEGKNIVSVFNDLIKDINKVRGKVRNRLNTLNSTPIVKEETQDSNIAEDTKGAKDTESIVNRVAEELQLEQVEELLTSLGGSDSISEDLKVIQETLAKLSSFKHSNSEVEQTIKEVREEFTERLKSMLEDFQQPDGGYSRREVALLKKVIQEADIPSSSKKNDDTPVFFKGETNEELEFSYEQGISTLNNLLPKWMQVKRLDTLKENIGNDKNIWGVFYKSAIYLANKFPKGTQYHEAFHVAIRMLMSDSELTKIFREAEAKYGKPTPQEIKDFRESHDRYKDLSKDKIELMILEEKLAEEFREYMNKTTISRRFEWINRLFRTVKLVVSKLMGKKSYINTVFQRLGNGKYRTANRKYNMLTSMFDIPMFSLISYEKKTSLFRKSSSTKAIKETLDSTTSNDIINLIVNSLVDTTSVSDKVIQKAMASAAKVYDINSNDKLADLLIIYNASKQSVDRINSIKEAIDYHRKLGSKSSLFQEVKSKLNKLGKNYVDIVTDTEYTDAELAKSEEEESEEVVSNNEVSEDFIRFNQSMVEVSPEKSLTERFKLFLSTIPIPFDQFKIGVKDPFKELGEAGLITYLPAKEFHAVLSNLLANKQPKQYLSILFSQRSENILINSFLDRLVSRTASYLNLSKDKVESMMRSETYDDLDTLMNYYQVADFVRAMNFTKPEPLTILFDAKNKRSRTFVATAQGVVKEQFDRWMNNFITNRHSKETTVSVINAITQLYKYFPPFSGIPATEETMQPLFKDLEKLGYKWTEDYTFNSLVSLILDLNKELGMTLSREYMIHSLVDYHQSEGILHFEDAAMRNDLITAWKNNRTEVVPYHASSASGEVGGMGTFDLFLLKTKTSMLPTADNDTGNYAGFYARTLNTRGEVDYTSSASSRIRIIARNNGYFDPSVGEVMYVSPDGNSIYDKTQHSYFSEEVVALKDSSVNSSNRYSKVFQYILDNSLVDYDELGVLIQEEFEKDEIFLTSYEARKFGISLVYNPLFYGLESIDEFKDLFAGIKFQYLAGLRETELDENLAEVQKDFTSQGRTFAASEAKTKLVSILTIFGNAIGRYKPIQAQILSSKKTNAFLTMPIIEDLHEGTSVDSIIPSDSFVDRLLLLFKGEANNIKSFYDDIIDLALEASYKTVPTEEYHTGKYVVGNKKVSLSELLDLVKFEEIGGEMKVSNEEEIRQILADTVSIAGPKSTRGLIFFRFKNMPNSLELAKQLVLTGSIDETAVREALSKFAASQFKEYVQLLESLEIISKEGKNLMLPTEFITDADIVNYSELARFFFNDYIISAGLSNILNGDIMLTQRNFGDVTKRNGNVISNGPNFGSGGSSFIVRSETKQTLEDWEQVRHGVLNSYEREEDGLVPTNSPSSIDTTDGQSLVTFEWIKQQYLKINGKSLPELLELLDMVELGLDSIFNLPTKKLEENGIWLQSKKLVYRDLTKLFKTSMNPITRAKTSKFTKSMENRLLTAKQSGMSNQDIIKLVKNNIKEYGFEGTYEPLAGRKWLHDEYNRLLTWGVSFVIYRSSSKRFTSNVIPANQEEFDAEHINVLSNRFLREPLNTDGFKAEVIDSNQKQGLIWTEMNPEVIHDIFGALPVKAKSLSNLYKMLLKARASLGFAGTVKKLLSDDFTEAKYNELVEAFKVSIEASAPDPLLMEIFTYTVEDAKGNVVPQYNFNFSIVKAKYDAMFMAFASKDSFKHKIHGNKFTQVSSEHYRVRRVINHSDNITREEYDKLDEKGMSAYVSLDGKVFHKVKATLNNAQEFSRKDVSKEVTLLINEFNELSYVSAKSGKISAKNVARQHKIAKEIAAILGYSITELRELIGDSTGIRPEVNKILQSKAAVKFLESDTTIETRLRHKVWDAEAGIYYSEGIASKRVVMKSYTQFGVRIPTQDKHSMVNIRFVDFLPDTEANSIMLPNEIIQLSGSDFDIDALYTHAKDGTYGDYLKAINLKDALFTAKEELKKYYTDKLRSKISKDAKVIALTEDFKDFLYDTLVSLKDEMLVLITEGNIREFMDEIYDSYDYLLSVSSLTALQSNQLDSYALIILEHKEFQTKLKEAKEEAFLNAFNKETGEKSFNAYFASKIPTVTTNYNSFRGGELLEYEPLTVPEANNLMLEISTHLIHNNGFISSEGVTMNPIDYAIELFKGKWDKTVDLTDLVPVKVEDLVDGEYYLDAEGNEVLYKKPIQSLSTTVSRPSVELYKGGFTNIGKGSSQGNNTESIQKPSKGVELLTDSGLSVTKANEFIDILSPVIVKAAERENQSNTSNYMFSFGKRWTRIVAARGYWKNKFDKEFNTNPEFAKAISDSDGNSKKRMEVLNKYLGTQFNTQINPFNKGWSATGFNYGYDNLDAFGNTVETMDTLKPITKYIESKIGIDLSDYNSVLGNIYTKNQFIPPHRDTTEDAEAGGYAIVVINIGADGSISEIPSDYYNQNADKSKARWKNLPVKNGGVYAFGVNGENRFNFFHAINTDNFGDSTPTKPLTLPDGSKLNDYRITLTYRRVTTPKEDNAPSQPARILKQPVGNSIESVEKEARESTQAELQNKFNELLAEKKKIQEALTALQEFRNKARIETIDSIIQRNTSSLTLDRVAKEEGLTSTEEAKTAIKNEVLKQLNDKSNATPVTLLQKIAANVKKVLVSMMVVAAMIIGSSFTSINNSPYLTYDNLSIENLTSFEAVKLNQDELNKLNDLNVITKHNEKNPAKYLVVDKNAAMAHLYEGANLLTSYEIGTGKNKGDAQTKTVVENGKVYWSEGNKTTGAGIYTINATGKYKSSASYTLLNERGVEVSTVLHETLGDRRKLFNDNNTDNNRMSYGCVNFQAKSLADLSSSYSDFTKGSKVYILPDNPLNKFKVIDGKLSFVSNDSEVNRSIKTYEAQPITVKAEDINSIGKRFLQSLSVNKKRIMSIYPTISNDEYNQLVSIAYGIFGQESSFGTYGIRGQVGRLTDLGQVVSNNTLNTEYNPSIGVTQIRFSNVRTEVRNSFGIQTEGDLLNIEKAAAATIAHLLDIYINEIPDALKHKANQLLPLAYSSHSDFNKFKNNKDESLLNNKYVLNVLNNSSKVTVYLGLNEQRNPVNKKSTNNTSSSGGAIAALLALLKRKREGDEIADEDIERVEEELLSRLEAINQELSKLTELQKEAEQIEDNIYNKLGNKTESGNVKIIPNITANNYKELLPKGSIYSMRLNSAKHFDNPFESDKNLVSRYNLIQTNSTKESVEKYIDWILNENTNEIKGINIRSDKNTPNSLSNKLTNPNWYAKNLFDVESNYKANASKIKAPQLNAEEALKYDMNLMHQLQLKKFRQNPELIDEINAQGGLEFIKQSSHIVGVKNSRWEGKGMESNFIKVLSKSYETVAKELGKFVENSNIEPQRRVWIREQLKSGNLKGKSIIYFKELGEPSHATALDYLINKYDWNKEGNSQSSNQSSYNQQSPIQDTSNFKVKLSPTLQAFLEPYFNSNDEIIVEPFAKLLTNEDKKLLAKAIGRTYIDIARFDWYEDIWSDVRHEEVFYYLKTGNTLAKDIENSSPVSSLLKKWKTFEAENYEFVVGFYSLSDEAQRTHQKKFNALKKKQAQFIRNGAELEYNIRKKLLKEQNYKWEEANTQLSNQSSSISESTNQEVKAKQSTEQKEQVDKTTSTFYKRAKGSSGEGGLGKRASSSTTSLDTAVDKSRMQESNDTGMNNIGVIAKFNITHKILVEAGINLPIKLLGLYDKFTYKSDDPTTNRTSDVVSSAVSSATDNSSLQHAADLALTPDTLGAVAVLVGMGASFTHATALLQLPLTEEFVKTLGTAGSPLKDKEKAKFGKQDLQVILMHSLEKLGIDNSMFNIPPSAFKELIKVLAASSEPLTLEDILSVISESDTNLNQKFNKNLGIEENTQIQIRAVATFIYAYWVGKQLKGIGNILNLKKGLDPSVEGLSSIEAELTKLGLQVVVKDATKNLLSLDNYEIILMSGEDIKKSNSRYNRIIEPKVMLKVFQDTPYLEQYAKMAVVFSKMITPKFFITETAFAKEVSKQIKSRLNDSYIDIKKNKVHLNKEFLNYLVTRIFITEEANKRQLDSTTMQNYMFDLLFKSNIADDTSNLLVRLDLVKRGELEGISPEVSKVLKTNEFLAYLSGKDVKYDDGNPTLGGLTQSIVTSNVWVQKSSIITTNLKDGWSHLHILAEQELEKHGSTVLQEFVDDLFLYLAAKDSFGFRQDSFIKSTASTLLERLSTYLDEAQVLLSSTRPNEVRFKELTGMTPREFAIEFITLYTHHSPNIRYAKSVSLSTILDIAADTIDKSQDEYYSVADNYNDKQGTLEADKEFSLPLVIKDNGDIRLNLEAGVVHSNGRLTFAGKSNGSTLRLKKVRNNSKYLQGLDLLAEQSNLYVSSFLPYLITHSEERGKKTTLELASIEFYHTDKVTDVRSKYKYNFKDNEVEKYSYANNSWKNIGTLSKAPQEVQDIVETKVIRDRVGYAATYTASTFYSLGGNLLTPYAYTAKFLHEFQENKPDHLLNNSASNNIDLDNTTTSQPSDDFFANIAEPVGLEEDYNNFTHDDNVSIYNKPKSLSTSEEKDATNKPTVNKDVVKPNTAISKDAASIVNNTPKVSKDKSVLRVMNSAEYEKWHTSADRGALIIGVNDTRGSSPKVSLLAYQKFVTTDNGLNARHKFTYDNIDNGKNNPLISILEDANKGTDNLNKASAIYNLIDKWVINMPITIPALADVNTDLSNLSGLSPSEQISKLAEMGIYVTIFNNNKSNESQKAFEELKNKTCQ